MPTIGKQLRDRSKVLNALQNQASIIMEVEHGIYLNSNSQTLDSFTGFLSFGKSHDSADVEENHELGGTDAKVTRAWNRARASHEKNAIVLFTFRV